MTLVRTLGEHIGASGVVRSGVVALTDFIASANAKATGGLFERTDGQPHEIYKKVLEDEGLEPLWETFFTSILTKAAKGITPNIPEQITMIPGKLLGAAWHWLITDDQSFNKTQSGGNGSRPWKKPFAGFYNACVKGPSEWALKACGIGNGNKNFLRYGLTQVGIFGLAALGLKHTEENLPGVDLDPDESKLKNVLKGVGYVIVEQITHITSQFIRYKTNFTEEFNPNNDKGLNKQVTAKALANVINERFIPGHIFSSIGAAVSTYFLGRYIPRTTAAGLGEFPFAIFDRIANCRRRRSTKCQVGYKRDPSTNKIVDSWYWLKNGAEIPNYRYNSSHSFNHFLSMCDGLFNKPREMLLNLIAYLFHGEISKEQYKQDLINSYTIALKAKEKEPTTLKPNSLPHQSILHSCK